MKPILLSQSDNGGGAARAAFRLHQALLSSGINNRMQVGIKKSDVVTVDGPAGKIAKLLSQARPYLGDLLMSMQKTTNTISHSPNYLSSGLVEKLNQSDADVINLHWINGEFISIEDIGLFSKPIIWTLHDMWAFCGAEHYDTDDELARWRVGYRANNRYGGQSGLDINRWVWRRKLRTWNRPMHVITPSHWLADCVKSSALMHDWPVTVIPNPLDTRQYQPWPKKQARKLLGLPITAKLVLFGAIGGGRDPRKGWDLLQPALVKVAAKMADVECVIFGQSAPVNPPKLGLPLHWMGHLADDVTLSLLYSAADIMLVSSRQENLPQSGTEAQACGCPVVAFNCTGMPDIAEHKQTGYLAKPYEVEDLAEGILWVLMDDERRKQLSIASRQRAVNLWSREVVVPKYLEAYESAIIANKG